MNSKQLSGRLSPGGICAAACVLLFIGGRGRAGEASEPVMWDTPAPAVARPAAPAVDAKSAEPAAKPAEPADKPAGRDKAAELEKALAQETKHGEMLSKELVSLWKQQKDSLQEIENLKKKLAESEKHAGRNREVGEQLAQKTAAWEERGRQIEALQAEQKRLQQQLAELVKKSAEAAGLSEQIRQQQTAAEARVKTLTQDQAQLAAQVQATEKKLAAAQARAEALEQQKTELAKAAADKANLQKELAALRETLAGREKELAGAEEQMRSLKAESAGQAKAGQAAAARQADAEARVKTLTQDQAQLAAQVQATEKKLAAAQARAETLEQQKAELAKAAADKAGLQKDLAALRETLAGREKELAGADGQVRQLRKEIDALNAQKQVQAETLAAQQAQAAEDLAGLRKQIEKQTADLAAAREQLQETAREADEQQQRQAADLRRLNEQMKEEGLVREGKALREQLGEGDNPALVVSLNDVGLILMAEGRWDQAAEMFRRALIILQQTREGADPATGTVLQHLAEVAWNRRDLDTAASFYEQAAHQFSAALGKNHARYAAALNGWAGVRRDQQRPQEAEELYRQAIQIYERDANSSDLVVPLHNLGLLLLEQNRPEEAGPVLERAEALLENNGGPDTSGRRRVVLRTLTRYYQAAGDAEKAAQCEEQANQLALDAMAQ